MQLCKFKGNYLIKNCTMVDMLYTSIIPNFRGEKKFRENIKNRDYVNFRDKNFPITPGEPTPTVDYSNFLRKNF